MQFAGLAVDAEAAPDLSHHGAAVGTDHNRKSLAGNETLNALLTCTELNFVDTAASHQRKFSS